MASAQLVQRIRNPPQPSTPVLGSSSAFVSVLQIAEIAMGAVYLHECPREPYIPIYLIVMGVCGLMLALLSNLACARQPEDGTSPSPLRPVCKTWMSLTTLSLFCWFVAGNVWIYSIYQPNYKNETADPRLYCNKTLYLFAFWTTTSFYILLGLAVLGVCCSLSCLCLCRCVETLMTLFGGEVAAGTEDVL